MVAILILSVKLATLVLSKIKLIWNKGYDVIISIHDVINKILSCGSNYVIEVVMVNLAFLYEKLSYHQFYKDLIKKTKLLRDSLGSSSIILDCH